MQLDLKTVYFLMTLALLIQAGVMLYLYREHRNYRGIGWWALGSVGLAIGVVISQFIEVAALSPFAVLASRVLFVGASFSYFSGVCHFFGKSTCLRFTFLLWLGFCGLSSYVMFFLHDSWLATLLFSATIALIDIATSWVLIANRSGTDRGPIWMTSGAFLTIAGLFSFRVAIMLLDMGDQWVPTSAVTLVTTFAVSNVWTYGFISLINLRLHRETLESQARFETIFQTNPDATLISQMSDGRIVAMNDRFACISGFREAEVLGKTSLELALWYIPAARQVFLDMLEQTGVCENMEAVLRQRDGGVIPVLMSARVMDLGGTQHIVSMMRDISALKKVASELEANQRFLADVIENNGALIYAKDPAGRYQLVNRKWEQETGLCREVAIGKTDVELFSTEIGATFRENDLRIMSCGCVQEIEEMLENEQGARYFISIKFPLRDANGEVSGICGVSTDITQRKQTEEELAKLNQKLEAIGITDALTGISNRRHFDEVLSQEYARHSRTGADLSLILLDIDHFKAFNDYYGHLQGDECLRQIGRILTEWTKRPADLAARYGGEEFACILPETDLPGAVAVAEHIRQAIVQATIPHEKSLIDSWVTASFGVASMHCSGRQSVEALVGQADAMLYQAKAGGRNRVESIRPTEKIVEK
jgi:diguanylate cyclase (GGDEF)-like protein/PAS domain S-box-containing protein